MPTRQVALSTTPTLVLEGVPRGKERKSMVITNQSSTIAVGVIDNASQAYSDSTRIPALSTRFYNRIDDGPIRLDGPLLMVSASGSPNVAVDTHEEFING